MRNRRSDSLNSNNVISQKGTRIKSSFAKAVEKPGSRYLRSLVYIGIYFFSLLYWELLLRLVISGTVYGRNLTFLFFIPAESLIFAAITGFSQRHVIINKLENLVILFALALYYGVQVVYYRIFGSVLSVNLLGMGNEAVGDFGWAAAGTIIDSVGYLALILIPVVVIMFLSVFRPRGIWEFNRESILGAGYARRMHAVFLIGALAFFILGAEGLRLLGTERGSAYYVLKDETSDTDITTDRIGSLATSVVEGTYRLFGSRNTNNTVKTVSLEQGVFELDKAPEEAGTQIPEDETPGAERSDAAVEKSENTSDKTSDNASQGKENGSEAGTDAEIRDKENKEDGEPEERSAAQPHVNEALDFAALRELSDDKAVISLCDYFDAKAPTMTNEYTGLFEGYNLVYICAEGFSRYGIDPDITPMLYEMANNGIVLKHFYNSFPNTTTNGEFAFATSLWPDVSRAADQGTGVGSFSQSGAVFMPNGLGDIFTAEGVPAYAYHNFIGRYYRRKYTWPNLGYENIKFLGQGMTFSSSWPASDLEMFEQSVDDYIGEDRFHAYYMTFSGHGPYTSANVMYRKNIKTVKELAGDKYKDDAILGYFCGEYEFELGLEYLVERLKDAGKLDKTVIVIVGDHYPYYLTDSAKKEYGGGTIEDVFEQSRSTCIIYNSGLEQPIVSNAYCCNVDILPTVLNLFGIEYDSRLFMGNDIFSSSLHRARLYNGSFITEFVSYDKKENKVVWNDLVKDYEQDRLDRYLNALLDYTENEYNASLQMIKTNFMLFAWKNAGLITEEEYKKELAREKTILAAYENEDLTDMLELQARQAPPEEAEPGENMPETPQENIQAPPEETPQETPEETPQETPEETPQEEMPPAEEIPENVQTEETPPDNEQPEAGE